MAQILTLIDGNLSPRPGEAGVVLYLRSSESGYRGQATAVIPGGQVTRRLGVWVGTCPVAVSQAMYQWVTSAGWHQQQISTAPNSEFRPDQILSGPQEIQPMDWSSDVASIFEIMLASFGPRPQSTTQAPQAPQAPQASQVSPSPRAPQRVAPPSSREQGLARVLGSAVKMLRGGSDADMVYQALTDGLADFASADELDDLDDDDLDGEVEADREEAPPEAPQRLRPLRPGEVPIGLTPDQELQMIALGDDRAREKMLRTMQRSEQAILRARQVAELQARRDLVAAEAPPAPAAPQAEPSVAPPKRRASRETPRPDAEPQVASPKRKTPKETPKIEAEPSAEPEVVSISPGEAPPAIMYNGVPCFSVETVSQLSGKSPATVRLWCRDGKLAGKAFQARVEGDKVDRWLIPLSSLEINGAEAQA